MRHRARLLVGLVVLLLAPRARASSLEILTTDGTPWAQLVERIQDDVASQGKVYALVVRDGGETLPCDEYRLTLDAVAAAAFRLEGCARDTSATSLRVVSRAALFEDGEVVPVARRASVTATVLRRGSADGGGAPAQAGSKIWCTVALQPYLFDRLRGQPVPLMPDRFVLRPIEAHIQATPDGSGWIARGESRYALRFHYGVFDARTESKVLENEASLVCADTPAGAGGVPGLESVQSLGEPWPPDRPPLAWTVALDALPAGTVTTTLVLVPAHGIAFSDGQSPAAIYGRAPAAVLGGTTVGFVYRRGGLFFPLRVSIAGDANLMAVSALAGAGLAWNPGVDTSLYAAVAPRFTTLQDAGGDHGSWNHFDAAALLGVRHKFWIGRKGEGRCPWGLEPFVEAAAPLGGTGVWSVSAGYSQWWGPGGGYYGGFCPRKPRSR
jgi:hypothetical protein